MLKAVRKKSFAAADASFTIVASEYNGEYVDSMLRAARAVLKRARAKSVRVIRVPGAFEIPVVVGHIARTSANPVSAFICLGVILRGQTVHAAYIGEGVSRALMELQLQHEIPIVHEVLLLENHEQARARCLDPNHNRGTEAAQTALAMAQVMQSLR